MYIQKYDYIIHVQSYIYTQKPIRIILLQFWCTIGILTAAIVINSIFDYRFSCDSQISSIHTGQKKKKGKSKTERILCWNTIFVFRFSLFTFTENSFNISDGAIWWCQYCIWNRCAEICGQYNYESDSFSIRSFRSLIVSHARHSGIQDTCRANKWIK